MSHSCPGNELNVEQLVCALAQALDSSSPLGRSLHDLEPRKVFTIERSLSRVLRTIRAIRNTYVPVNRLPPEILSNILEYHTSEWDLVNATHVCRYWRSALISSPSLWTCFPFQSNPNLDRTLTFLERSKSAPIDLIDIDTRLVESPQGFEVLEHLAPHITRTKSLLIMGPHGTHTTSLLFCHPAPFLQCLQLYSEERHMRLPENFLGQHAPSLRYVRFSGICPTFKSPFPLPNLTEFFLYLVDDGGSICMNALFRFLSNSPLLQKIHITAGDQTMHDTFLDQVTSLNSLVELEYNCNLAARVLPFLKLPCLQRLEVSLLGPRKAPKLVDILPHDGRALLARATGMVYYSDESLLKIDLFGNGIDVSLSVTGDPISVTVDWFSDQACIPFGQIEELTIEASPVSMLFPAGVSVLENLRVLRANVWDVEFAEEIFRLFHPDPEAGVPCRSLREIKCTGQDFRDPPTPAVRPLIRPLTRLAKKRKQAGYQLRVISLTIEDGFDQGSVEELKEHVGEVRIERWDMRHYS